jgi:hypothetical protein
MNPVYVEVSNVMEGLFRRHPALCGFAVREDLSFSNVSCHPALHGAQASELLDEISETLHDLLEERPEAADMLRGRTLARAFH